MKSLWNDNEAAKLTGDLELRVYSSKLLGQDPTLVLHGGGNTSVKIKTKNILGEEEEILYVKGSGWDLATIEKPGFSPVRLDHLLKLATLPRLNDMQMVNELRTNMTLASAPTPSVEAILHATIPFRFVDHTHSNAVVTVTNTEQGVEKVKAIFGDKVVIIPYVMPGFDLARLCAEEFEKQSHENTIGMVLLNHGIFSFADDAKLSYERMIELVSMTEAYIQEHNAWDVEINASDDSNIAHTDIAQLRYDLSAVIGQPMIISTSQDAAAMSYINRKDIAVISQQGPATPDHVIRTKRLPMLGRDLTAYSQAYQAYFTRNAEASAEPKTILDTAPRVILDAELGLCTAGRSIKDAKIVADIYRHTMEIIQRSEMLGGYKALPENDIFDVEYWDLEQAKLKRSGNPPVFTGEVALVTGAASGIGLACVESLLARGAAVIALDINPKIATQFTNPACLGIVCDISDEDNIKRAINSGVKVFGGIDMLILNAGIFPAGCRIESLATADWKQVMNINLDSNLVILRECHPFLKLAPNNGRVVFVGSKNVPAPGPGAAAYSASKAALNQLARVAALEWAADGIRLNTVHPDAVFDTGIWTDEVLSSRAAHYGMTVDEYKRKNLLKTEVTSKDVAEMCAEMCGSLFAKSTGVQLPIDGGNDRVI